MKLSKLVIARGLIALIVVNMITLFNSNIALANTGSIEWQKYIGLNDVYKTIIIEKSSDGGSIEVRNSDNDCLIIKSDKNGTIEWQKTYGESDRHYASEIKQTSDGGYILVEVIPLISPYYVEKDHCCLIKLDKDGTIEWEKTFGGNGNDIINSIQETSDGGYILVGSSTSKSGELIDHNDNDGWIAKLDKYGTTIEWQKKLGTLCEEKFYSVEQTSDGGYIVAGYTDSDTGKHCEHPTDLMDEWIIKFDKAGNIEWEKYIGGNRSEQSTEIHQTIDGGYIISGYTYSRTGDFSGNHGGIDGLIIKLDNAGNIKWQKLLGGSMDDHLLSMKLTSDGGCITAGYTDSNNGDAIGNHGSTDGWVVKLNDVGKVEWEKDFGGSNYDIIKFIQETSAGEYIATGINCSSNDNVAGMQAETKFWILKLVDVSTIISPSIAAFDKYVISKNNLDITVSLNINGNVLSGIKNGSDNLIEGQDYSVTTGSSVTIDKDYLNSLTVGENTLDFIFNGSENETLSIVVSDSTPAPVLPSKLQLRNDDNILLTAELKESDDTNFTTTAAVTYDWYSNSELIKSETIIGDRPSTYTITNEYKGTSITVKTDQYNLTTNAITIPSDSIDPDPISQTTPAGVRIGGTQSVGKTLEAEVLTKDNLEYTTSSDVTYKWYRLSSEDDHEGDLIGEDKKYTIVADDKGKYIKLIADYNGNTFEATTGKVSDKSSATEVLQQLKVKAKKWLIWAISKIV